MLKNTVFFVLLILLSTMISACSPNTDYRNELLSRCNYVKSGDCEHAAIQYANDGTDEEYHLGFVEFDDQGQLWDRHQLKVVLSDVSLITEKDDVLLVIFVHGWHHSASPTDSNVLDFRNLLKRLARAEADISRNTSLSPRKVLGVYIGWRGDSIAVPWLNYLTYWDRKNTAHNVGGGGAAEVFLKLEEIVNTKVGIADETADSHHSRLVVMAHSFGGALVSAALHQILTDRFIDSRAGKVQKDEAKGFGDLVVMLNPAFEALRFASLYDISQQDCRHYSSRQLPKLVILTSEADWATKYIFKAGRKLSTFFEKHSVLDRHYCSAEGTQLLELDEERADQEAVGHFEPFRTHRLSTLTQPTARKAGFDFQSLQHDWEKQTPAATLKFESVRLRHLDRTHPLNPYLSVYVDKALINGHNDIWGEETVSFIRDMIMISTMSPKTIE